LVDIDATTKACYVYPSTHHVVAKRGNGLLLAEKFCATTNGTSTVGTANCICGLGNDLASAGPAVDATTKKCLVLSSGVGKNCGTDDCAACTVGAKNTAAVACKCGMDGVDVAQNSYCLLKSVGNALAVAAGEAGIATSVKPCSNTTSGAAVDAACKCGLHANGTSVGTDIADTKFCYVSFMGVGQAEKAAAVAPAATCVNPSTASPAGTTAPGVFAALFAAVAFALRM